MGLRTTTCSFCGKSSKELGPMLEGPNDVYMCVPCLHIAEEIVRPKPPPPPRECSFCGKSMTTPWVEGPADVYMCSDCVHVGRRLVSEHESFRIKPS